MADDDEEEAEVEDHLEGRLKESNKDGGSSSSPDGSGGLGGSFPTSSSFGLLSSSLSLSLLSTAHVALEEEEAGRRRRGPAARPIIVSCSEAGQSAGYRTDGDDNGSSSLATMTSHSGIVNNGEGMSIDDRAEDWEATVSCKAAATEKGESGDRAKIWNGTLTAIPRGCFSR